MPNRYDYLMLAIDVGASRFNPDRHSAEADGAPNARFDIVFDYRRNTYCYAGKILARSDPDDGFATTVFNPSASYADSVRLAAEVSRAFDHDYTAADFRLVVFSEFA